eukprot:CAMPEP_0182927628 /NCGR_PEP_ID=MMETSP0105_2-20130417/13886_1 /TAXON_ID=81532 ORGANISM="Acanthoeca-like sp., Strain 10tr" /NCGR_SAMPLE_ID=MMETSP0105_2 /ASSEMBLY_ACC=CAM_ASM_000205 /LENGTH=204 /DNA_ID=CAMNT_0025065585 /DNA_START=20 /DNA_END=634 /DNA_ORIENTATION=+
MSQRRMSAPMPMTQRTIVLPRRHSIKSRGGRRPSSEMRAGHLSESVCLIGDAPHRAPKYRYDHRQSTGVNMALTGDVYQMRGARIERKATDASKRRMSREMTTSDARAFTVTPLEAPRSSRTRRWSLTSQADVLDLPPITDVFGRSFQLPRPSTSAHHGIGSTIGARATYGIEPSLAAPNNEDTFRMLPQTTARGFKAEIPHYF